MTINQFLKFMQRLMQHCIQHCAYTYATDMCPESFVG